MTRIRIDHHLCIKSKPTNQQRFFPKSGQFFPVFEKRQERPPPTPLFSYVPVVIRKCRITLLNKFAITKTFPLRLSAWKDTSCLFRRARFIQHSIFKRMCKTAFSTMFRAMKLNTDVCGVFLIFISINQQFLSLSALYIGLCSKKNV